MVGVEGDCAILDSGADLRAAGADDVEIAMKSGNKVGISALVLLALSIGVALSRPQSDLAFLLAMLLPWVAVVLLIYAGSRGSRWWFALPLMIFVVWSWVIAQGV